MQFEKMHNDHITILCMSRLQNETIKHVDKAFVDNGKKELKIHNIQ